MTDPSAPLPPSTPNPPPHPLPPPIAVTIPAPAPAPRRRSGWKILLAVCLLLILLGGTLLVLLVGAAALVGGAGRSEHPSQYVTQEIIREGGWEKIAILPATGSVDEDMVERVRKFCDAIRRDKSIKAVIVQVDSPGGSVTASDEIHHLLTQLRQRDRYRVVVSMGGLAASGGYYISMPAEKIYAMPTTLTGSIGVIWPAFEVSDLMTKIGVTPEIITSDNAVNKDRGSPFRKFTPEDVAYIKAIVNNAHEKFAKVVADGRKGKLAKPINQIATGTIWPSEEALDLGLIDQIAYLDEAADDLAATAGLHNPTLVRLKESHGIFDLLGASAAPGSPKISVEIDPKKVLNELQTPRLEYRWVP